MKLYVCRFGVADTSYVVDVANKLYWPERFPSCVARLHFVSMNPEHPGFRGKIMRTQYRNDFEHSREMATARAVAAALEAQVIIGGAVAIGETFGPRARVAALALGRAELELALLKVKKAGMLDAGAIFAVETAIAGLESALLACSLAYDNIPTDPAA